VAGLRAGVPDDRYHDGTTVSSVDNTDDGATITFDDGATEQFDVVVGADGYRSMVRHKMIDVSDPVYAGYILWRGNFPEAQLSDRVAIDRLDEERAWLTVGFDGGHAVMYPIPDFDDEPTPGCRRINWAIYAPEPADSATAGPRSIPPGSLPSSLFRHYQQLVDKVIPPAMRPLFTSPQGEISIQPVYDASLERYVNGRVVLIGDAGTLSRPHTGSGATKAMQDARYLEQLGHKHDDWDTLLAAYDADRVATGNRLVDLGRRIGHDQVDHTPPWTSMTPEDFGA
jgi:2-polyprenyl-6-methoxyphenol hydroxylase-like FAD-dependent oxidoreductase